VNEEQAAGEPIPSDALLIEVRVAEMRQLFNAIDPSPFREKDLERGTEAFIVEWAREASGSSSFALLVHLDRSTNLDDDTAALREAIRAFFADRARSSRRALRRHFATGRISLAIGLATLVLLALASEMSRNIFPDARLGQILQDSLVIGGWVAMWRPLEMFLYDWWPIRADARLYDRLSEMPVRVVLSHGQG
jgi:hypothetical protein